MLKQFEHYNYYGLVLLDEHSPPRTVSQPAPPLAQGKCFLNIQSYSSLFPNMQLFSSLKKIHYEW